MSPYVNSSYLFKTALVFYFSFVRGRFKRRLLISIVSVGNVPLCRGWV